MAKIVDQTDGDVPYAVDMYNGGHVHTWISLDFNKDDALDPRECTCLRSFTGRDYVTLGEAMPGNAAGRSGFLEVGVMFLDSLLQRCQQCVPSGSQDEIVMSSDEAASTLGSASDRSVAKSVASDRSVAKAAAKSVPKTQKTVRFYINEESEDRKKSHEKKADEEDEAQKKAPEVKEARDRLRSMSRLRDSTAEDLLSEEGQTFDWQTGDAGSASSFVVRDGGEMGFAVAEDSLHGAGTAKNEEHDTELHVRGEV